MSAEARGVCFTLEIEEIGPIVERREVIREVMCHSCGDIIEVDLGNGGKLQKCAECSARVWAKLRPPIVKRVSAN